MTRPKTTERPPRQARTGQRAPKPPSSRQAGKTATATHPQDDDASRSLLARYHAQLEREPKPGSRRAASEALLADSLGGMRVLLAKLAKEPDDATLAKHLAALYAALSANYEAART